MEQNRNELTEKQKRKKAFLLLLPVFIIPFLTLLLWSVGIVGTNEAVASTTGGLNAQLPDAKLKDSKAWNKLSFYEQADKDSIRFRDELKNDPSLQPHEDSTSIRGAFAYNPLPQDYQDPNEVRVNQKLAQLNAAINSQSQENQYPSEYQNNRNQNSAIKTEDVNRLEQMLENANQSDSDKDPETEQLNGMMDKILDIQHPERVKERIQQESNANKKAAYPVTIHSENNYISLLEKKDGKSASIKSKNVFFSLSNDTASVPEANNTFSASVYATQTLTDGSLLKLITQDDIYVSGTLIPQGTFIYATVSFSTQRLHLAVSSIRYQNNITPVELVIYDDDGLEGIHISNIQKSDIVKQSGSDAVSNFDIGSFDPSVGAQAASAGIAATKALLNKKVKTIKVTIPAGYKLFLKSNFEN